MINSYRVQRHRTLPNAGSRTLFFTISEGPDGSPPHSFSPARCRGSRAKKLGLRSTATGAGGRSSGRWRCLVGSDNGPCCTSGSQ